MGIFNWVFPFLGFWTSRTRDLSPAAPGNSNMKKTTNNNNKIEFLLFIPILSLAMKNPKPQKLNNSKTIAFSDAAPSLPLKSPNQNPRPNFGLPILILVFGVPPHGTTRCSWPIVVINVGPGG